jgi:hypothetical protein
MDPTQKPTIGDKVKAAVAGVVPPALGGTAGTGEPMRVTAQEEAAKREMRREAGAGVGMTGAGGGYGAETAAAGGPMDAGGGYGAETAAAGGPMGAGAEGGIGAEAGGMGAGTATGAGTGRHGGIVGGLERGAAAAEAGVERVLHRATGQVIEDRPVVKEVRQEFVEHRPVAQHVETVTRVTGETAVEGGARLEPVGPPTERVVREGTGMAATGMGAAGTAGLTREEEEERLARGRGGGGAI